MSTFQLVLLVLFFFFAVLGVIFFALYRGPGSGTELPEITLWGTFDRSDMERVLSEAYIKDAGVKVRYTEKDKSVFERDFVEALASGEPPDAVILPPELFLKHANKLAMLPFESLPERTFRNNFVSAGEIFLLKEGAAGLPFLIDPLVMFWNRTLFSNAGVALPPRYWDELLTLAPAFTQRDKAGNITRSFIALGEHGNVRHASAILSALMLQGGNSIVGRDSGGKLTALLTLVVPERFSPTESALRFYTDFADPAKSVYSWNRGLPDSRDFFVAGKLGLYLGFASEIGDIRAKNPNLDFDVATVPQVRDGSRVATYGRVYALVATKASPNQSAAWQNLAVLVDKTSVGFFAKALNLQPARRDLLSESQKDPYLSESYRAALQSYSSPIPGEAEIEDIFGRMISSVTSGRARVSEALSRAQLELQGALNAIRQ